MIDRDKIIELYVAMFQRAPSKAEVDYWYNDSITHQYSQTQLAENMVNGAIYATKAYDLGDLYPDYANLDLNNYDSIKNVIESVYKTLFDKSYESDPQGIDYWAHTVYDHTKTLGEAILDIVNVALDIPQHPDMWQQYYLDHGYSQDYFNDALKAAQTYTNRVQASKEIADSVDSIDTDDSTRLKEDVQTMQAVVSKIKTQDDIQALKTQLDSSSDKLSAVSAFAGVAPTMDSSQMYAIQGDTLYLNVAYSDIYDLSDVDLSQIKYVIGTNNDDNIKLNPSATGLVVDTKDGFDVVMGAGDNVYKITDRGSVVYTSDASISDDDLVFSDGYVDNMKPHFFVTLDPNNGDISKLDMSAQSENGMWIVGRDGMYDDMSGTNQNDQILINAGADRVDALGGDDYIVLKANDMIESATLATGAGEDYVFFESWISDIHHVSILDYDYDHDKILLNKNAFALGSAPTVSTLSVYDRIRDTSDTISALKAGNISDDVALYVVKSGNDYGIDENGCSDVIDLNGDNTDASAALVMYEDGNNITVFYVDNKNEANLSDDNILCSFSVDNIDNIDVNALIYIYDGEQYL
ncbi:MAG: hypothetical protein GXO40_03870 [Epsilonproteobacteria bacterium]|nr:hypothetical protein [Campylobacterota bacterium]